jgi:hypothetical protein
MLRAWVKRSGSIVALSRRVASCPMEHDATRLDKSRARCCGRRNRSALRTLHRVSHTVEHIGKRWALPILRGMKHAPRSIGHPVSNRVDMAQRVPEANQPSCASWRQRYGAIKWMSSGIASGGVALMLYHLTTSLNSGSFRAAGKRTEFAIAV